MLAADDPGPASVASVRRSSINVPVHALPTGRRWKPARFTERSIALDERLRPYRHLAVRVLARALLDAIDPGGSSTDRESARAFLAGSIMLEHWCRVAGLDPACVAEHAERFTLEARSWPDPVHRHPSRS
jgi:hypothetical protein